MLVKKLLEHFDAYELLHVDVNDVRDQLVDMGVQDEIRFHFVKMDAGKLRGIIYRYHKHAVPYGEPILCSEIVISDDMGDEDEAWKRIVAVKEMLHIADCVNISAESREAIDILFKNFSLPHELRHDFENGAKNTRSYLNDGIRIYVALAILIPEGCRLPLRELNQANRISDREIADIAKVPVRYIPVVMDPAFEVSLQTFLGWEEKQQA